MGVGEGQFKVIVDPLPTGPPRPPINTDTSTSPIIGEPLGFSGTLRSNLCNLNLGGGSKPAWA